MAEKLERGGYNYYVSDEQLRRFRSLSYSERLRWLEEMQELTASLAPAKAKRWWRRFREGTVA